jgi:succinate dehydrogenase / fumarate reductase flavoprotein subunit
MYERITDENGYKRPMRIYPAPHYTMGGLWVDYNLMSNVPGLFVLGEANFSVHGANRLGASALMQGLADGYFVIPFTIAGYLAQTKPGKVTADHAECKKSIADVQGANDKFLKTNGKRTVTEFIRELGTLMWNNVGMARTPQSLADTLQKIPAIREEFWKNVKVTGTGEELNQQLENAGRTADFIEFAELLARDAQALAQLYDAEESGRSVQGSSSRWGGLGLHRGERPTYSDRVGSVSGGAVLTITEPDQYSIFFSRLSARSL